MKLKHYCRLVSLKLGFHVQEEGQWEGETISSYLCKLWECVNVSEEMGSENKQELIKFFLVEKAHLVGLAAVSKLHCWHLVEAGGIQRQRFVLSMIVLPTSPIHRRETFSTFVFYNICSTEHTCTIVLKQLSTFNIHVTLVHFYS